MSRHFTQDKGRQAWVKWFTTLCIAPSISAHPATREMMKVFRPEFNLPSHTAMKNTIDDQARKAKKELMSILKEARYVATTADSWSAHHRAFLGCTVHWIDAETLRRKHGTLACKELKSNQTKELLANEIYKINSEFGITRKIVATTTDNGANYCAAFAHFGDNQDDPLAVAPEHEDPDGGDVAIVSVHDLLEEEVEDEAEDLPKLPTQRRCAAHTLNLLATTDVSKVVGWNYGTGRQARQPFTKAAAKAQGLWNLHNRSSVVANKIRDVVGRKLNTPCPTRWNTLYDATECLLKTALKDPETIEAINEVMKSEAAGKRAAAPVFTEEDKEILQEYCKVMKPVAICLDRLQAEVNAYMGILLPYLMLLKRDLQAIKREGELRYADPLVDALLEQDGTVHGFNNSQSQDMVTEKPKEASDDPFAFLESPTVMEEDGSNIGELIKKEVDTWGRSKVAEVKPGQFPSMHREKWISLFIKYNTALPSSAAVERMFSTAGDVLRPKRASMTSDRFEKLVFTKGNMQLLDAVLRRERREGECDSERETDVE
ncbi:putative AC9 transposase [Chionoecetes opilio]|nr:putative AC9 transposase [Chionoecetes opilio]